MTGGKGKYECEQVIWTAIDLGASNVRFAVMDSNTKKKGSFAEQVLKRSYRIEQIPPCFSIKEGGRRDFGLGLAKVPWNVVFDANYVQSTTTTFENWKWFAEKRSDCKYRLNDGQISLSQTEAISFILASVRHSIENFVVGEADEQRVKISAVIVVPSFCKQIHRQMVFQAARIAGFDSVELLNQSTAIAIAYRFYKDAEETNKFTSAENLAVLSIGAQSTEFTVFSVIPFEPIKTVGRVDFGGTDFTARLVEEAQHILAGDTSFKVPTTLPEQKRLAQNLWKACEEAKIGLERSNETEIRFAFKGRGKTIDLNLKLADFEQICSPQFQVLEGMLNKIDLKALKVNRVVFAGSSSRLHWFQRRIDKMEISYVIQSSIAPEEAAICGATLKSAALASPAKPPVDFGHIIVPDFDYCTFTADSKIKSNFEEMNRWNNDPSKFSVTASIQSNTILDHPCLISESEIVAAIARQRKYDEEEKRGNLAEKKRNEKQRNEFLDEQTGRELEEKEERRRRAEKEEIDRKQKQELEKKKQIENKVPIHIRLFDVKFVGKDVNIWGSWNNWTNPIRMRDVIVNGISATVKLPPGRHEFLLDVNGRIDFNLTRQCSYPAAKGRKVSLCHVVPSDIIQEGDYFLRRAGPAEKYLMENGKDGRLVLGRDASQKGLFRLFYGKTSFVCSLQSVNSDRVVQFKDQISHNVWGTSIVEPVWGIGAFSEEVKATPAEFVFHSIDARTRTVVLCPSNYGTIISNNWFLKDALELCLTDDESKAMKLLFVKANSLS